MAEAARNQGRLLETTTHAATTEIDTGAWKLEPGLRMMSFWVRSSRGGTLKIYRTDAGGVASLVASYTIAINTAGEEGVVLGYPIPIGRCGFTPADATSGTTRIEMVSA